jgi:hypothetical protein
MIEFEPLVGLQNGGTEITGYQLEVDDGRTGDF